MVVGLVISHQLTPGFLLGATTLLAVCGATRLKTFPVLVAAMFLAWLSFGAAAYWVGHLDTLTRSVGQVGTLLNQNVGRRTQSTELGRQVVVGSRIVLAVVAWGAAALAIVLAWRKHRTPVALLCLFVAPFGMLLLQSYGGEMVLRVCYFTLPPVSILIAGMLVPSSPIVSLKRALVCGAVIAVLIPAFVLARFGNESFESFSDADIQLSTTMYQLVPDGSVVVVASSQALMFWQRVDEVRFLPLPGGTPAEATAAMSANYLPSSPVFVMLSESQAAYGVVSVGLAPDWMDRLIADLEQTGRYHVAAQSGRGVLLELER